MKHQKRYTSIFKHPMVAAFVLALPLFGNSAFAQTLIYDGTTGEGKVTTVLASAHEFEKLPWLSLAGNTQGVLPIVRGNISSYEVDLTIDYSSGAEPQFVMGGYRAGSDYSVESNTLRLQSGAVNGPVYGGLSHTTAIEIGFRPAKETDMPYSFVSLKNVNNKSNLNSVFISEDSNVKGNVYGGAAVLWAQVHDVSSFPLFKIGAVYAQTGVENSSVVADNNIIILEEGAAMTGDLHGGFASMSLHTSSAIAVEEGMPQGSVAQVTSTTENVESSAANNTVILERDSTLKGDIYGGSALFEAVARDAKGRGALDVRSDDAIVWAQAIASNDASVSATNNSVKLYENSEVEGNVYGGYSAVESLAYDAVSGTGYGDKVSNASVTASGSYNVMKADGNTVTLEEGSSITGDVYGGSSNLSVSSGHAPNGNGAFVEVGVYGPVLPPEVNVPPHLEKTSSVQAVGNTVSLEQGSSVGGNIFGGYVERKMLGYDGPDIRISAKDSTLLASENRVVIDGKASGSAIYGGYVKSETSYSSGPLTIADFRGSRAEAVFNTVTIGEHAELAEHTHVFGGFVAVEGGGFEPETIDAVTGNTLEFHASGMRLTGVSNFENYTFHVTENAVEDEPLLSIAATPLQLYTSGEHIIDFTHSGSILATLSSINILAAEAGLAEGSDIVLWSVRGGERWGLGSEDFSIGWDDNILSISWMPIPEPGSYIALFAFSVVVITLMRQRRGA